MQTKNTKIVRERSNLSLEGETIETLSRLSKAVGRPMAKVVSALALAPDETLIPLIEDGLKKIDFVRREKLNASKRERNTINDKLSHLTPGQLDALIAQAEKLK